MGAQHRLSGVYSLSLDRRTYVSGEGQELRGLCTVARRPYVCLLILWLGATAMVPSSSAFQAPQLMQRRNGVGDQRVCRFYRENYCCDCYHLPSSAFSLCFSATSSDSSVNEIGDMPPDSVKNIQWELFRKHHARFGNAPEEDAPVTTSWVGRWTTYDYVGDILLETMPASVNYIYSSSPSNERKVQVTHTITTGSVSSDCATCFDDPNTSRTIPITTYTPESIGSKTRLGACSMVVGPSILQKSGTMALEIVLSHTSARVRIVFQHAPVWARGIEPGSCPPQGLKLIRCLVARETLLVPETAPIMPGTGDHPIFDRSVPPFDWHKKWSGTSWTWGPEAGDRGWSIPELDIGVDDWHGSAPVEAWNLRLPGGIFIQLPRVITSDAIERCRLAWMPDTETLLRVEAGVLALQPILEDDESDSSLIGFEPPSLASFRCDVLQKIGDLEGLPSFVTNQVEEQSSANDEVVVAKPVESKIKEAPISNAGEKSKEEDAALRAIDDALQF